MLAAIWENTQVFLPDVFKALWIIGITLFYMALLWVIIDLITPFDDWEELYINNNVALLCQRAGMLIAQPIAMAAVFGKFDVNHPFLSARDLAVAGAWIFLAMVIAYFFVDWLLFPKIPNHQLLIGTSEKPSNTSVGIVEGAFYVGIGFLLNGSLTGSAPSTTLSVASTIVFYLLGLLLVFGIFWLHEWWTPYCVRDHLLDNDRAVAVELAGVLIAASIVVRIGVAGDFVSWPVSVAWFVGTTVVSVVLLYATRWVSNRVFLRRHTVKEALVHQSVTAVSLQAVIMVLAALGITAIMGVV